MKIKHVAFLLGICFSLQSVAQSKAINVEISRSSSDALTKSLEEALRTRISHSMDFSLHPSDRSALNIVILDALKLKKVANHHQAFYKVNLLSREKIIGTSTGICWDDQLSECAEQILRDAKITIHQNP